MAAGESGVLWVAGGNAIHRIFYDSPQTSFGVALGPSAIWPQVARWNDKTVVCAGGSLYLVAPGEAGHVSTLHTIAERSTQRTDRIAAAGNHLLGGTGSEVFSVGLDGTITPVLSNAAVSALRALNFIAPDLCLIIGGQEIAAVRYANGQWAECAPRIPGVGDAPIHTETYASTREPYPVVWVEMGGDQIARLTFREGQLHLQRFALPWKGGQWANVGRIDGTIIISSATGLRTYYDEAHGVFCEAPHLDKLLNRSPYWLLHVTQDDAGTLWATHQQGVVTYTPKNNDYIVDSTTFELRNDSYPAVNILSGSDTWITAGRSLYHVERQALIDKKQPQLTLVSLVAEQQNRELLRPGEAPPNHPAFSFDNNSLSFRFFSGTYAWSTPLQYEYRLGPSEPWRSVDPSMILRFPRLQDGAYLLEVRRAQSQNANEIPFALAFTVRPPWYRTPTSYTAAGLALVLVIGAMVRWLNHRARQQTARLERVVQERTKELKSAMEKLGEETRSAATLAERSRLAGEIHDSLQQGLSGAILMLDTTMANPELAPTVHAQLNLMRGMLSYSREEVQQAVWDLASPFLQNATLSEALKKIASYINSGTTKIDIVASTEPVALAPMIQHNLLRIAQEAITNAVKHAGATHIEVALQSDSLAVVLSVSDDGRGFDPKACAKLQGHFGLRGLRARARTIHAQLQIISAPGAGSTIRVTAPLKKLSAHAPRH